MIIELKPIKGGNGQKPDEASCRVPDQSGDEGGAMIMCLPGILEKDT